MGWRHDVAWAAGFFDGEGSTCAVRRNGGRIGFSAPRLSVPQKDRAVLDRLTSIFGFGTVGGPFGGEYQTFRWMVSRHEHVQAALAAMWPHLSRLKKDQATSAFRRFRDGGLRSHKAVAA